MEEETSSINTKRAGAAVSKVRLPFSSYSVLASCFSASLCSQPSCRLPEESGREVANLLEIEDHYPKYVVTLDELAAGNINGVKIVHLADFLLCDAY